MTNHQRIGVVSNAHAGRDFEVLALAHFKSVEGLHLKPSFPVAVGHGEIKKLHRFDLGGENPAILVECKSHN